MKRTLGILVVAGMIANIASAALIVAVDSTTNTVGGTTVTFEANEGGGNMPNTGPKYSSVTVTGTDRTATILDPSTRTDYYCEWKLITGAAMAASTYTYAEIHYSLSDDFNGDVQKFRLGDTVTESGSAGAADEFSNPELLNATGGTAGSHKFIVDLTADVSYEGDWKYVRWNIFNSVEDVGDGGKSITIDKIIYGTQLDAILSAYYVAATPTDWADSSAWSDGNAATAGVEYYVTNGVVLNTPAVKSTFPGKFLSLVDSQRMDLLVSGTGTNAVITVDDLRLEGATLAAGQVDAGEAQIDGTINVSSNSAFSGAADSSRDLRVLSQVAGSDSVLLDAPTKTIYIDNAGNTFDGTWVLSGGTGEFSGNGAVGSASIDVQNGTLRIRGAWNGLDKGDSLTVADSPSALVELGTNEWTVVGLTIGSSNVLEGATYTAAELNAIAVNAVFTGSGSIQVGPPPIPPQPELLVGWERWVAGAGSTSVATIQTNGFTGVASNGGFGISYYAACTDGTFGSLLLPPASATQANDEGVRKTGAESVFFDFAIQNTSGTDVVLGAFHFDALLKKDSTGPQQWSLQVLSGAITTGEVATNALGYLAANSNLADYDVSLTGLADHTLEAGGSVVFRVSFTGGVPGNIGLMDMDNVALTKYLAPTESPVITFETSGSDMVVSWPVSGFKLQTRPQLTLGDWVDVPGGAASPVTVPATNDVEFLRLIAK